VARFHKAYKNYGKILICFHCTTYVVWFGSAFLISYAGLEVVPILQWLHDNLGLTQTLVDAVTQSGAGHFFVAFLLCKVIGPIRYLTTIVGTKYVADGLKKRGIVQPVPAADSLGNLAKESGQFIEEKTLEMKLEFGRRVSRQNRRMKKNARVTWRKAVRDKKLMEWEGKKDNIVREMKQRLKKKPKR